MIVLPRTPTSLILRPIDKIVRIVVGIVLLYVAYAGIISGIPRYVVGLLGVIMLAAAALSYCPLYPMLKINTAAKEK